MALLFVLGLPENIAISVKCFFENILSCHFENLSSKYYVSTHSHSHWLGLVGNVWHVLASALTDAFDLFDFVPQWDVHALHLVKIRC